MKIDFDAWDRLADDFKRGTMTKQPGTPADIAARLYDNFRCAEAHLMALLDHGTREACEGRTWDIILHDDAVLRAVADLPRASRETQIDRLADGLCARRLVRLLGVSLSVVFAGDWHVATPAEQRWLRTFGGPADAATLAGWV